MNNIIRPLHLLISALLLTGPFTSAGLAQSYPRQIIKIIVPFLPGGGVDVVARVIAPRLGDMLGQSVIVENRGGAGGSVGATFVAQAPKDGYTLLLGTGGTHGTNPVVYTKLGYDAVRDFAPIALITRAPFLLVANKGVPVKTAADLVALAKAKPGTVLYGSYGTGSSSHLAAELFNSMAGIDSSHIPYRGSAPMTTDLIGGRIQFAFDSIATSIGMSRATPSACSVCRPQSDRQCFRTHRRFPKLPCPDSKYRSGSRCSHRPARLSP